jgi:hypothetical protein
MRARQLFVVVPILGLAACNINLFGGPEGLVATISGPSTLQVGASAQYRASVTRNGKPQSPTGPSGDAVMWASSDDAIATVTPLGVVTGVAPGRVTISGTPLGFSNRDARTPGTILATVIEQVPPAP